jgi:hypothetical protein
MVAFVMVGPVAELVARPERIAHRRTRLHLPAGFTVLGSEALAKGSGVDVEGLKLRIGDGTAI